jgi:hypothetical protein
MTEKNDGDPVSEPLCKARMQTVETMIMDLKNTVKISAGAVGLTVTVIQIVLFVLRR